MHCDLDLWPFDLKIYRAHPCLMGSLHKSFMMIGVKGKQICARNPNVAGRMDGQTDGRTDMVIPVYPPNFVRGGIINTIKAELHELCMTFCIRLRLKIDESVQLEVPSKTRHVFVKHECLPQQQSKKNMANLKVLHFDPAPSPRGMWSQWSMRNF